MIEKATRSVAGVIPGGTLMLPESRRLKFGLFLKDLCYVIGGRMAKSVALTDYRRIPQKRQGQSAVLPIPASSVACRCIFPEDGYFLSVWKSKIVAGCPQSAFGGLLGPPKPRVDNLPNRRSENRNQQLDRKEKLKAHENALTSLTHDA